MRGHIRERTTKSGSVRFQLVVYAGTDSHGRKLYVRETHPGPRRQAEVRLAQLVAGVAAGAARTEPGRTLHDAWNGWWQSRAPSLSPNTVRGYERIWRCYLQRPLGHRRLCDITPEVLERLYAQLAREGGKSGRPLSSQTVRATHMVVATLLTTAARWDWITTPHAATRALTPSVPNVQPVRAPESHVIRDAIAAAHACGPHIVAFLRLAAITGARREELCALRWDDFDPDTTTMRIDEAVKKSIDGTLVIGPTKTHQQRTLTLDGATFALVEALRSTATPTASSDFVFGTADGTNAISPDAWTNRWRRLRTKVPGAAQVRLHDFRHWQGTQGAQVAPLPVVQARLGHSRLTTTGIYAKRRMLADAAAAAALAEELAG